MKEMRFTIISLALPIATVTDGAKKLLAIL